jgi:hypothetical protein
MIPIIAVLAVIWAIPAVLAIRACIGATKRRRRQS